MKFAALVSALIIVPSLAHAQFTATPAPVLPEENTAGTISRASTRSSSRSRSGEPRSSRHALPSAIEIDQPSRERKRFGNDAP